MHERGFQALLGGMLGVALSLMGNFAQAQNEWPTWPPVMSQLRAGPSESSVSAELPSDTAIEQTNVSTKARWGGIWRGWACFSAQCDVKIAIEKLSADAATVVYAAASAVQRTTERGEARFVNNDMQMKLHSGATLVLRLREDGDMEMSLWSSAEQLISLGVLTQKPFPYARTIERVPTPWQEGGRAQTLEMVVYRPAGSGPFPTLIFNHGSTGQGDRPDLFTQTWASPEVGRYFTDNGWQVVFPQRRGRGKSDGVYDEGFEHDRSRYACKAELSLPGLERAMADLDAVLAHLRTRADVDMQRLLIGGVSRGGIISVVYAGTHAQPQFLGVLNFVGGWIGDRCEDADKVNTVSFVRGAAFPRPTLWLYGANDPFYSLNHSRRNFDAFTAAGGKGDFMTFEPRYGVNGHFIHTQPALWEPKVGEYLRTIERH